MSLTGPSTGINTFSSSHNVMEKALIFSRVRTHLYGHTPKRNRQQRG